MKKLLLLLVLTGACSDPDEADNKTDSTIMTNNFESLAGWVPANNSLTAEQAHSGKYSVKVDKGQEYSMGFSSLLGKVSAQKPHKIKLSGYVYLPNEKSTAHYQLQILDPVSGQKIFEDGIVLADQVKSFRNWVQVEKVMDLPQEIVYTHEVRVFLWGPNAEEATYLDDAALTILE